MFDSVTASYPDSLTEIYVYSMKTSAGPDMVTGVVEVKYLAADKTQLEYAKRTL
jgi:hypothetical protein